MSYDPVGCTGGGILWGSQCDPANNCTAGPPYSGCDRGPGGSCSTCSQANFAVALPPSDPPSPDATIFRMTKAGAIVCHPGKTGLTRGDLVTAINGEFPTLDVIGKVADVKNKAFTLLVYKPALLAVHGDTYARV